jgi:hypothetical protein
MSTVTETPNAGPSLLDLATELLLIVFAHLEDEDLLRISLLSTRLHHVALELYLSRHGSYSETSVSLVGPPFRMLPALRMALFVQDLPLVSLTFLTDWVAQGMLKGLERLIRRVSCVKKIEIHCGYGRSIMRQREHLEAMEALLVALAGKACVELTMTGWYVRYPHDWTSKRPLSKKIRPVPCHDLPPLTSLNAFHIRHCNISSPTLRTWTINSINLSPITSLTLHSVTFSSHSPSSEILRLLALPLLSHLYIYSDRLIFSDVVIFLGRHPRVTNLSLAGGVAIISNSPFPAEALPILSVLKAPPHFVNHILSSRGALPSLEAVVIDPDFPPMLHGEQSDLDQHFGGIEECFVHLASREDVTTLRLILPPGSWAAHWLSEGSNPGQGERRSIGRSLVHITTLEVDVCGCSSFSPEMAPLFVRWLALFPALRYVTFDSFTFRQMSSNEQSAFADSIGEACSSMEAVEIRYTKYVITH